MAKQFPITAYTTRNTFHNNTAVKNCIKITKYNNNKKVFEYWEYSSMFLEKVSIWVQGQTKDNVQRTG